MTSICCSILDEFKDINFKDKRLNNRFNQIMNTLETSPSGLISKAFIDTKDQKAAYRFLENSKTNYEMMLQSHQLRVKERCQNTKVILAVQDSTSIALNGAKKADNINSIGSLKSPGLNIHTSLLVTPQLELLGISDIQSFERHLSTKRKRHNLPAEEKETGKWLRAITNTRKEIDPTTKLVWVADREGDFWDYFTKLSETNEWFVQRVVHRREIEDSEEDYFTYLKSQPVIGISTVEISSRGGESVRDKRTMNCEVRTAEITLKKPKDISREMKFLKVQAIHVIEKDAETPLEWFLITNIQCDSFEAVAEKIKWYQTRWIIEELHRVVKSGCGIEEMRLEDSNRLMKYLLLLFIVGMRILWMTKLAKHSAEVPCTIAFSEEEWKLLYIRKHKKEPPEGYEPTIKEALRLLAMFGGFYDYNKKRDPGTMTIWRGMKRLMELMDGLETLQFLRKKCG